MILRENVPLAPLTTLKIGGPARYFVEAGALEEVVGALDYAASRQLPLFVLGGGSNLVVSDRGWPGLVLKINLTGIDTYPQSGKSVFRVAAGEDWDTFVAFVVAQNCSGIECLSGIPGTTGGTPVQNVGAYGQEVSQTISSVDVVDRASGQASTLSNHECHFTYRTSIFNDSAVQRFIVLSVTFQLHPGGEPLLQYADLKTCFAKWQTPPTLAETREAVRQIRLSKAMLIVPGDDDCRSAGSFFKNPVLSEDGLAALRQRAAQFASDTAPPAYPAGDGKVKVSAAWLVERSGFSKGMTRGPVGISSRHSLAIVNRGGATAADIMALKNEIENGVYEKFGVSLKAEPVFVGFDPINS